MNEGFWNISSTCWELWDILYLNFLEGAVEHGNEHIQQDDHHDDVIHSIQHIASVLNELMVYINDH